MHFDNLLYQSHLRCQLTDLDIAQQLSKVIDISEEAATIAGYYQGKVRDSYQSGTRRLLITSDRLSAFDVHLTTIPFKGQVLNQTAIEWFRLTKDIVANHLIDVPHANVMLVHDCQILPIEVVVRGYLTGSAWRSYQKREAVSGIKLPEGLLQYQKLASPILTPSTKAPVGEHDLPISEQDIIASGIVSRVLLEEVRTIALALFDFASKLLHARGLLLVDTKYEFGLLDGKIILADEIHTLDSSRFWNLADYQNAMQTGTSPKDISKEPIRQWLLKQGYHGVGPVPHFSDEHRIAIARHYISSYEQILGQEFNGRVGSVALELRRLVREFCGK